MNKNILYLLSILEAIEKIKVYKNDFKNANDFFEANLQKEFNATINLLIVIGEEARKIDDELKSITDFEWKSVIGLRNFLSHNYKGIDPNIIWDIVNNKLDKLKEICILLVKKTEIKKEQISTLLNSPYYKNIKYLLNEF
ncbi:MAG: DUF86 domain-containing protein [Candidatus Melainabacteria bacterium]|nr:DUF86 domain-containing protein [Candidatus Melainabacteria bacterium]